MAEIELGAGQAFLKDRHHRNEHLGGDLRVELHVLILIELWYLLECLLDKRLYLSLLQLPLVLVHDRASHAIVDALSSDTSLVVTGLLVLDDATFTCLLLIQSNSYAILTVHFFIILLERYVA